jgi:Uma2 family endonuclease
VTDAGRVTVDDVADLAEGEHFELLDGKIVWPPSLLPSHQSQAAAVAFALDAHAPTSCVVSYRQAVMVDRYNMPFVDAVAMRIEAATRSPVPAGDVLVAAEVISVWSEEIDRETKMQLYARAGIPSYWVIDPLGAQVTLTQFLLGPDGSYRRGLHSADVVMIDQPWQVALDLPAMTRKRDRIRAVARPDR